VILGVGIDIVEVRRIRAALGNPRTGSRFQNRVFTAAEAAYCARRRNGHESFAARFAAKEAMIKVLGRAVAWQEIEVTRTQGPPSIRLHGRAHTYAEAMGIKHISLSLSHTAETAVAVVIAED